MINKKLKKKKEREGLLFLKLLIEIIF